MSAAQPPHRMCPRALGLPGAKQAPRRAGSLLGLLCHTDRMGIRFAEFGVFFIVCLVPGYPEGMVFWGVGGGRKTQWWDTPAYPGSLGQHSALQISVQHIPAVPSTGWHRRAETPGWGRGSRPRARWAFSARVFAQRAKISLERLLFLRDSLGAVLPARGERETNASASMQIKLGEITQGCNLPIHAEGRDRSCLQLQLLTCVNRQNMQGICLISPFEASAVS